MTANRPSRRPGFSLVEVMTVCVIMGILASFSVPRFGRAMEQSRANIAVANLRAIWTAQRIYWLQNNNTFALDLATLRDANLLDPSITDDPGDTSTIPAGITYVYQITPADPSPFHATARRVNSTGWAGTLTIDSSGADVTGSIQNVSASGSSQGDKPIDQFFQ